MLYISQYSSEFFKIVPRNLGILVYTFPRPVNNEIRSLALYIPFTHICMYETYVFMKINIDTCLTLIIILHLNNPLLDLV